MKKIWKAFLIFEIIVFVLFFSLWLNYEGKWLKEDYAKKYDDYSYGIYRPVISQVNLSTGCEYNFKIEINEDKIAKVNGIVNKVPN